MTENVAGITIPDSQLTREITGNRSRYRVSVAVPSFQSSVLFRGACGPAARAEIRSRAALLRLHVPRHGATHKHSSACERFEVDGANAARDFLKGKGISQQDIDVVWTSIALHTTPGIPQHMHPVIALVTAGVEMDVLGLTYPEYSDVEREAVVRAHPRTPHFKEDIIQAFYDGIKHKPDTTFGNVKADVLADKDPHFHAGNFCSVIRSSAWVG